MVNGCALKDPSLLRDRAYIDGQWTAADDGGCWAVGNPADGSRIASVADLGAAETRRGHCHLWTPPDCQEIFDLRRV